MQPVQNPTKHTCEPEAAQVLSAVILAGRLRPSTLREAVNVHVLCLPVGRSGTLLQAWMDALKGISGLASVRVVVNTAEDAAAVRAVIPRGEADTIGLPRVEVMAEPASWRGAAGIVRDVTEGMPDDAIVLVCEGKRLPPPSLNPVIQPLIETARDTDQECVTTGVVGISGADSPAGVYAFRRRVLKAVPRVGYFDMKEQLLPALAKDNQRIAAARLSDEIWRLGDLETYLATVRQSLNGSDCGGSTMRVSARASVSGSAVLNGFCVIEPGAVIEDGAVVHDSVVLWGATVGGGAVVSRSVVGPLATVEPRSRVVRAVVSRDGAVSA